MGPQDWRSVREVAELLDVKVDVIYGLIANGTLRSKRLGAARIRVDMTSVESAAGRLGEKAWKLFCERIESAQPGDAAGETVEPRDHLAEALGMPEGPARDYLAAQYAEAFRLGV